MHCERPRIATLAPQPCRRYPAVLNTCNFDPYGNHQLVTHGLLQLFAYPELDTPVPKAYRRPEEIFFEAAVLYYRQASSVIM